MKVTGDKSHFVPECYLLHCEELIATHLKKTGAARFEWTFRSESVKQPVAADQSKSKPKKKSKKSNTAAATATANIDRKHSDNKEDRSSDDIPSAPKVDASKDLMSPTNQYIQAYVEACQKLYPDVASGKMRKEDLKEALAPLKRGVNEMTELHKQAIKNMAQIHQANIICTETQKKKLQKEITTGFSSKK